MHISLVLTVPIVFGFDIIDKSSVQIANLILFVVYCLQTDDGFASSSPYDIKSSSSIDGAHSVDTLVFLDIIPLPDDLAASLITSVLSIGLQLIVLTAFFTAGME